MILLFGGTTEGRETASLLDGIGENYFYSTRTENLHPVKGTMVSGVMDKEKILAFCRENSICLIIDAAHPFAMALHRNIHDAAEALEITTIRFERARIPLEAYNGVRLFDSFAQIEVAVLEAGFQNILALTGVQTIPLIEKLWKERHCFFRILDTSLSRQKAKKSGIPSHLVFPMQPDGDAGKLIKLAQQVNAEVLLSKESGTSGFMESKVATARELGIPLWVVKRPALPDFSYVVEERKQLLQILLKLRKNILKRGEEPRSGFSTGTCVTAAVRASFMALAVGEFPESVEVELPDGEVTSMLVFPLELVENRASCVVVKDAGDDPDVTHAREIGCEVAWSRTPGLQFLQGKGIGRVTMPGLQVEVGQPAVNPVPRVMITSALEKLCLQYEVDSGLSVKPFVPEGEELASKTFNPRVGVEGGISILGTSGRVKPFSNEAFLASVKQQFSVAWSSGTDEVVLTSGKRSENRVRPDFTHLPDAAFLHYGNLAGDTLKLADSIGITRVNLAMMLGKSVKLAAGELNTHSKKVLFDAFFAAQIARECGHSEAIAQKIEKLNLANAIPDLIPFSPSEPFYRAIARKCFYVCTSCISSAVRFTFVLLVGEENKLIVG